MIVTMVVLLFLTGELGFFFPSLSLRVGVSAVVAVAVGEGWWWL